MCISSGISCTPNPRICYRCLTAYNASREMIDNFWKKHMQGHVSCQQRIYLGKEKVSFFTEKVFFLRSAYLPYSDHLSTGAKVPSPAGDPNQAGSFCSKKQPTKPTITAKPPKPRTVLPLKTRFECFPVYLLFHSGYTLLNVLFTFRKLSVIFFINLASFLSV